MAKKSIMKLGRWSETHGNGYWSKEERKIKLTKAKAHVYFDHFWSENKGKFIYHTWGELRVYFDNTWRVERHGLIYTDRHWIKDLRRILASKGFSEKACKDVDYSEQGMQGSTYVSLDIGNKFIKEWHDKGYPYTKDVM